MLGLRRRSLSGHPPDDRRPAALAEPAAEAARRITLALLRIRRRHARAHRSRQQAARVAASRRRRSAALAAFDAGRARRARRPTRERSPRALRAENHTLKRALTDPHLFSGIGNAYSDEILHRAQLSPLALTRKLDDADDRAAVTRRRATARRMDRRGCAPRPAATFPKRSPRFVPEMAVHGRFGQPCPVCGAPVQRIVYAENESQLLRALPDRRHGARRPRAVAAAAQKLAAQSIDDLADVCAAPASARASVAGLTGATHALVRHRFGSQPGRGAQRPRPGEQGGLDALRLQGLGCARRARATRR